MRRLSDKELSTLYKSIRNGMAESVIRNRGIVHPVLLNKDYFNHFLRVNNRKKKHCLKEIKNLGYDAVKISSTNLDDILKRVRWCEKNLKKSSFIFNYDQIVFAYSRDFVLYSLSWE